MNEADFDALARALPRRGIMQGLAGLAAMAGLFQLPLDEAKAMGSSCAPAA